MVSALDVAAYILREKGPMSAMKLQKLVYYCQAWSLVWDESPMFAEAIEAWRNGPVVRLLYEAHRGQFLVEELPLGDPDALTEDERDTVTAVLWHYGDLNADTLSMLTHSEPPWIHAREGLPDDASSWGEIDLASMAEYYSSIPVGTKKQGAEAV